MSLTMSVKLQEVAKTVARDLRRRQTAAERIFWEAVRNRKFHGMKFVRQHPIFYDYLGKETFYVADFYCAEAGLVVEIDGAIHDHQRERDDVRTAVLNAAGTRVVRIRNRELSDNPKAVFKRLASMLER